MSRNTSKIGHEAKLDKLSSQQDNLLVARMTLGDVDELTAQMAGWENDWRQLEVGQALNQIDVIAGQHTVVQNVRLSHSVHQQGKTPDQLMTFGFPNKPSEMMWNGRAVPCPAVFDFNGKNGYDAVSGKGFHGVTLSLPKKAFIKLAEQLDIPVSRLNDSHKSYHMTDENHALFEFRRYLYGLFIRLPDAKSQSDGFCASAELDEELPVRLLTALASSQPELNKQPLKMRESGLRTAIEFLEENCRDNPAIPDVYSATGLSWRSLDRAFRECFGIGPKRYLMNLRLTKVRRSLTDQPHGAKIIDIANGWGFWHMGDFAREYRQMFCELPSETLRQGGH
jgi:AraC family ethanolamine operon transcriptional activator